MFNILNHAKNVSYLSLYYLCFLLYISNSLKVQAMEWFRMAAQQGHPKSSYNLAIGHLSGMKTHLEVQFHL